MPMVGQLRTMLIAADPCALVRQARCVWGRRRTWRSSAPVRAGSDVLDAPGENDPPGHVIRRRIGANRSHLGGGLGGAKGVAVGEPQLRDQVWRAVSVGKADGEALETGDCLHERHVPLAVGSLEVVAVGGGEVPDGDLVHRSSITSPGRGSVSAALPRPYVVPDTETSES